MIKIHLSNILGEKRWTQAKLAKKTGIRPNTICDLYNDFADKINLKHLDKMCTILECNVSDILEYVPANNSRPIAVANHLNNPISQIKN